MLEKIEEYLLLSLPLIFMVALFAIFFTVGNGFPDTSATPEQGFWMLFDKEMPDSVTDIECHGAFWMDHSVSVRFEIAAVEIENLTEGYQPIEWAEVESQFELAPYQKEFDGRWLASQIPNKKCCSQIQTSENYETCNYLVIDLDQITVYGISKGNVIDRSPAFQDDSKQDTPES